MSERKEDQGNLKRQFNVKIQVLDLLEKGEHQVDIGMDVKLPNSTNHTILKNKDKIKSSVTSSTASSAKKITRSICYALEEMEMWLYIWINDYLEHNIPLSQAIIMEKARSIYSCIQSKTLDVMESFSASSGWFDRFKKRNNLYNIKITGEEASSDLKAATSFPANLKEIVERGKYPPELVFNVDETGLFWKWMPSYTFISWEHKRDSGPCEQCWTGRCGRPGQI